MRQGGSAPLTPAPLCRPTIPTISTRCPGAEAEEAEDEILDQATAAQTLAELEAEIAILKDLEDARAAPQALRPGRQVAASWSRSSTSRSCSIRRPACGARS